MIGIYATDMPTNAGPKRYQQHCYAVMPRFSDHTYTYIQQPNQTPRVVCIPPCVFIYVHNGIIKGTGIDFDWHRAGITGHNHHHNHRSIAFCTGIRRVS
jgi:hypothetical protein